MAGTLVYICSMCIRGIGFIFVNSKRMAIMEYAKYCIICGKKLYCQVLETCPYDRDCKSCSYDKFKDLDDNPKGYCTCNNEEFSILYKYSVLYAEHMDLYDTYRETQIELLQKHQHIIDLKADVECTTKAYKDLYSKYIDLKVNNNNINK